MYFLLIFSFQSLLSFSLSSTHRTSNNTSAVSTGMISLPEDDSPRFSRAHDEPYTLKQESTVGFPTRIANCLRFYDIPAINFVIIGILGIFLLKLTTKYKELYMKNSLITIIVTNLVLYGISETLAQTILCYNPNSPRVSFRIRERRRSFALSREEFRRRSESLTLNPDDPIDDENLNSFLDYIQAADNESMTGDTSSIIESETPLRLTYFHFNRLAGFMCWGFILAFFQSWWYSFLHTYTKHPQFIEVIRKVMSDQFCYSPVSLCCFFIYGTMVLESGTWEDAKAKLRRVYLKTLIVNFSVWFPVQFINFLLVPRSFQVPFSSSVSVLWNCFLSMRNSSS